MAPIPTAVVGYGSVVVDGKIYIFGGESSHDNFGYGYWLSIVQIFDPQTNTWTQGSPMPTALGAMSACLTTGDLLQNASTLVADTISRTGL